jgi:hypothetical protein
MPTFTPVPSKAQVLGAGCILSILGKTGVTPAGTAVPIGELSDYKFDGFKRSTTTNTNFDSGNTEQNLGTILSYGTLTGTYNRVSNNAGQLALLAALQDGASYDFTLVLEPNILIDQTTGDSYAISGIVTAAGAFDLSQTKVSQATFTITLNVVTFTAGTVSGS